MGGEEILGQMLDRRGYFYGICGFSHRAGI